MSNNSSIFSESWCGIVFAGRNQAYGAYQLRKISPRNTLGAFLISTTIVAGASYYTFMKTDVHRGQASVPDVPTIFVDAPLPMPPVTVIIPPAAATDPPKHSSTLGFAMPIITPDELDVVDQHNSPTINIDAMAGNSAGQGDVQKAGSGSVTESAVGRETDNKQFMVVVQQMPEFPGGETAMMNYLAHSIIYPAIPKELGVEGTVYIKFIVDQKGMVTDVAVARGADKYLDKEAVRVISEMPKWKPGMQNGQAVRVQFTVPIHFKMIN